MESSNAGLPVPPGTILTVHFFEPWMAALKNTEAWQVFLKADSEGLETVASNLKKAAQAFIFTKEQEGALSEILTSTNAASLFAVRSSSPNEDLSGASFAGGYETVLGVTKDTLRDAIRRCFLSALDYRVFAYMRANGFDINDPKIAVVIQKQIWSSISGVGFSLNPVTNDFDEAVINSNWGLGETVVAGTVTPNTFTVDKLTEKVKNAAIGSKETSLWLLPTGGTEEKRHSRSDERTLSDAQLARLTGLVKKVESHYHMPMDIEWAFENEILYLLQARPITTYVPLSSELMTAPGIPKRLYFDITSTAQAMSEPMSKMGTSLFRLLIKVVGRLVFLHDVGNNIDTAIPVISDGKLFFNISNGFRLVGKKKVMELMSIMDELSSSAISELDERKYASPAWKVQLLPYGIVWRIPGILLMIRRAQKDPKKMHAWVQERLRRFETKAAAEIEKDSPLEEVWQKLLHDMFVQVFLLTVPLTIAARYAISRLERAAGNDPGAARLMMALPYNVTTEMGLALSEAARLLPEGLTSTELKQRLAAKDLPEDFLHAWGNFLEEYGYRGAAEIDVAAVRYYDDPSLLIDLLLSTKNASGETPAETFQRKAREREAAFEKLYKKILVEDPKKAAAFERDYRYFATFGGYRETHKKYLVLLVSLVRRKVLASAQTWFESGRLDTVDQVFDLTIEQFEKTRSERSIDLRKLAQENTVFLRKLARVKKAPNLIDSRGFIPRPARASVRPGEYSGSGVSVGSVRGKIKILHTPNEKPLLKGEILVARATDPGWTPLFVNAGGIILEVGGSLQHGALVAREYGIPCVVGIENATTVWTDGTLVEVDGTQGIVRTITDSFS